MVGRMVDYLVVLRDSLWVEKMADQMVAPRVVLKAVQMVVQKAA